MLNLFQQPIGCLTGVNASKINNILTEDMGFLIYDFIVLKIGHVFLDGKHPCSGQEVSHLTENISDSDFLFAFESNSCFL